jgi:DNA-binding LacI/PurR family transcriptional regulator
MTTQTLEPQSAFQSPTRHAIRRELENRLGTQWPVGTRLPPIKDLARLLGAGQNNTHQVVRELTREGWLYSRQRQGTIVVRAAATSAPKPPAIHTDSPSLQSRTISLRTQGPQVEGFIRRIMDAFRQALAPTGAQLTHHHTERDSTPAAPNDSSADAVVVFNPNALIPVQCAPHQILTVVTSSMWRMIERTERYDLVTVDEYQGGMLAGNALRLSGCPDVCFVGCRMKHDARYDPTSSIRLFGFEAAWGQPVEPNHMLYVPGYSPTAGGSAFRAYMELSPRPHGIFVASDDIAVGFIAAAASHDMHPGKDFQIVGFDGQERAQTLGEDSLTTVKVPAEEMGRRAAALLCERFLLPDRPVQRLQLPCALQTGTTTSLFISRRTNHG